MDAEQGLQETLEEALGLEAVRDTHARRMALQRGLYRFSVRLAHLKATARVHTVIVDGLSRCVGARVGALALYSAADQALSIVATHGYHAELVAHVRIKPGEGVFGRVFASGRPLRARAGTADGGMKSRRYRTDSFLAVPLRGPDGVFGVVAVTEHRDGTPFSADDLLVLRAFAVPASLALEREIMRSRLSDAAHLASVDPLTGAFNRRHFDERLEQEIQRQRRDGGDLALLMLDIDDFKQLNDSLGHLYGDRVLREVVDIIRRSVRIFDLCARFGGEEFAILMPGANAATALQVAERIRRNSESYFSGNPGRSWATGIAAPTLSIGVSTAHSGGSGESLIAEADAALLAAKAAGKNTVRLYADVAELGHRRRGIA
jgi:diguanylate cyclase (GGDEF)-like protein